MIDMSPLARPCCRGRSSGTSCLRTARRHHLLRSGHRPSDDRSRRDRTTYCRDHQSRAARRNEEPPV